MRIYVACLAAYNNGYLHGAWIEAQSDTEAMQEEITEMLKASPVKDAEEWAIHDLEDLPRIFGEFLSLDSIAEYVELTEEHSDMDEDDLSRIVDEFGSVSLASEALEDGFCGVYQDFREYSDDYVEECIFPQGGDNQTLINYFDL